MGKKPVCPKIGKVPECKYAQPNYFWEDVEKPGWTGDGRTRKFMDLRGHWKLTIVRCTFFHKSEDDAWKEFGCFHWCKEPEKCDLRVPGKSRQGVFSWAGGSGENLLSKDT
jgi:hypothetical protein